MNVAYRMLVTPSLVPETGGIKLRCDVVTINDSLEIAKNADGTIKVEHTEEVVLGPKSQENGYGYLVAVAFESCLVAQMKMCLDAQGRRHFLHEAEPALINPLGASLELRRASDESSN